MARFIVVQPNGLFAFFSTVVDDFTHMDMTRGEALDECRTLAGVGRVEAEEKVRRAEAEGECAVASPIEAGRPLTRWLGCLGAIEFRHGRQQRDRQAAAGARRSTKGEER